MLHYLWWIPITLGLYFTIGWLSVKNNVYAKPQWMIPLIVVQMLPFWVAVTAVSKNLFLDAIIYDLCAIVACLAAIAIFSGIKFSIWQIVGVVLVAGGILLIKLTGK